MRLATTPPRVVAVGVDETSEGLEAARYAAAVADERGWDLLVVHAYQLPPGPPGVPVELLDSTRDAADRLVDEVLRGVQVSLRTEVLRVVTAAGLVTTLRDVSHDVSLLVLGQHQLDRPNQLLLGRVGSAVCARAACPVVVVPPGWTRWRSLGGPVVVALDAETPAAEALRLAFDEAERLRTGVVALHAVPLEEDASFSEDRVCLEEVLAGAKEDHPDTTVRTRLVSGDPRTWIVHESMRASLMVVGHPHHAEHLGGWSRSVARSVMDRSFCPVAVAPLVSGCTFHPPAARRAGWLAAEGLDATTALEM